MSRRVQVGRLKVSYDEVGSDGRPLVLVHGFTGSKDDFADVLGRLGELGHTLAPDLRGHGDTTNPGTGYCLDQLAKDLSGFLDAVGVSQCDLLGHSLGGMVALRLVLMEPERIASLVLMDTSSRSNAKIPEWTFSVVKLATRIFPMRWHWRAIRAFRRKLPEPMRRAQLEMGVDRYWDRLRRKLEAMDPVAFDTLLRAIIEQQPLAKRLCEIACPTTILVGAQDKAFLAPSRELADNISDSKLVIIQDAHHSPQIEATETWLTAIQSHLERARA